LSEWKKEKGKWKMGSRVHFPFSLFLFPFLVSIPRLDDMLSPWHTLASFAKREANPFKKEEGVTRMESVETIREDGCGSYGTPVQKRHVRHQHPRVIHEPQKERWSAVTCPQTVIRRNFILEGTSTQQCLIAYGGLTREIPSRFSGSSQTVFVDTRKRSIRLEDAVVKALQRDRSFAGIVRLTRYIRFVLVCDFIETTRRDSSIAVDWVGAQKTVSHLVKTSNAERLHRIRKKRLSKQKPTASGSNAPS
jgi:hypothetical protein